LNLDNKTMTTTDQPRPKAAAETPAVPLTTEGYSVLHQMMRFRRTAWRALPETERTAIAQEALAVLAASPVAVKPTVGPMPQMLCSSR